jgi:hypothetical protein
MIKKFIDPDAEIIYVSEDVIKELTDNGVLTFDAADAKFKHNEDPVNGKYSDKCTFQIIMDEYNLLEKYPALKYFSEIVYAADIAHRNGVYEPREGYGFWAMTLGFSLIYPDDKEKESLEFPLCDALYAYCQKVINDNKIVNNS